MVKLLWRFLPLPLAGATLLGGCATYAQPVPSPLAYSYFAVSCDTPGALRARRLSSPDDSPPASTIAPLATAPSQTDDSAVSTDTPPAAADECIVAVKDRGYALRGAGYYRGGYSPRYPYPYGYYGPSYDYYGSPFFRGSLGVGFRFGSHYDGASYFSGSHLGGSHFGGSHLGGGHLGGRGHH